MLAHHRSCGSLWWVCAKILAAPDATLGVREASHLLETDRTADRLGATLPLLDDDQLIAVVGWPDAVDLAMVERFDVAAVALRVEGSDPAPALRRRTSEQHVRIVDPWDPLLSDVPRFFVTAAAISPDQCLVPAGTGDALDALGAVVGEVWVIGGVGRVLPARLYDVVRQATFGAVDDFADDTAPLEELPGSSRTKSTCWTRPNGWLSCPRVPRSWPATMSAQCGSVPRVSTSLPPARLHNPRRRIGPGEHIGTTFTHLSFLRSPMS